MGLFSGFLTGIIFEAVSEIARPTVTISSTPEKKAEPQKVEVKKVAQKKAERKDVKPEVIKHEYF